MIAVISVTFSSSYSMPELPRHLARSPSASRLQFGQPGPRTWIFFIGSYLPSDPRESSPLTPATAVEQSR